MHPVMVLVLVWATTANGQDHDVRLSNTIGKGRVEVFNKGQWGNVCKDGWGFFDALVVCKQLGFPWLDWYGWARDAGNGVGPVWLSNVRCNGSETRLDECAHDGWMEHQCTDTSHAAAVSCMNEERFKDRIFYANLDDGGGYAGMSEGRVLMDLQTDDLNQRFLICDQGWDLADAHVICRMHGLPSALQATTGSYFGKPVPDIGWEIQINLAYLATDFACTGNENHILQCPAKAWFRNECPTGRTAGVICNRIEESEEFAVRLMGGSTPNEGRVEVSVSGTWGSVCMNGTERGRSSIGYRDSNVICGQLGLGYGLETPRDDRFGRTDGPVAISNYFSCSGGESSFAQCYFSTAKDSPGKYCFNKKGSHQASVICSGPVPASRSPVRGGGGILSIYHDGRWGTICNAGWTLANSQVACREMGFRAPKKALTSNPFGGIGPIFLSGVSCTGDEETLDQCDLGEWYQHDCSHRTDVHFTCAADAGCVMTSFTVLLTSVIATLMSMQ